MTNVSQSAPHPKKDAFLYPFANDDIDGNDG